MVALDTVQHSVLDPGDRGRLIASTPRGGWLLVTVQRSALDPGDRVRVPASLR